MNLRILFITNRNILTTCGELRLIKNRSEHLFKCFEIRTDFIALAKAERINSCKKEMINAGGKLFTIRFDLGNFISIVKAQFELKKYIMKCLSTQRYDAVVLSGSGMPAYAKIIKKINSSIGTYADIHGASEDIIEVAKGSSLLNRMIHRLIFCIDIIGIKKSTNYLDGYFVVTRALKDYLEKKFDISDKASYYVVPCAIANTDNDFYENYKLYRNTYREKYEIKDSTKVFVYSGGTSTWQSIEETIDLYKQIKKEIRDSKFLIFSHNHDAIKKLVGNTEDVIIDSYRPEELSKALCAGDIAFLLRKNCVTNNVAFPNKFLEYVQSKMKIISTPYVYEIAEQINKYNIGILYKSGDENKIIEYVKTSVLNDDEIVQKVLEENGFENRLKPFVEDIVNVCE